MSTNLEPSKQHQNKPFMERLSGMLESFQEAVTWNKARDIGIKTGDMALQKLKGGLKWTFNFQERPKIAIVALLLSIGLAEKVTNTALLAEIIDIPQNFTSRLCANTKSETLQTLCEQGPKAILP